MDGVTIPTPYLQQFFLHFAMHPVGKKVRGKMGQRGKMSHLAFTFILKYLSEIKRIFQLL